MDMPFTKENIEKFAADTLIKEKLYILKTQVIL
jgi:hypothetical protein